MGFDQHHDLLTGVYHAGHGKVRLSLNQTAQKLLRANALIEGETAYAALELAVAGFTEAFDDWLHCLVVAMVLVGVLIHGGSFLRVLLWSL